MDNEETEMENFLRARIRERLDALAMNPFEAATKAGQNRHFLSDLLIGKKNSLRQSSFPDLAEVLDCDVEYLIGSQASPRRVMAGEPTGIAGVAELDVWRPQSHTPVGNLTIGTDPRYPPENQAVYRVRGAHANWLGMADGDYLVTLLDKSVRDGDVILFRRRREGKEEEVTARKVEDGHAKTLNGGHDLSEGEVVGRVIFTVRYF